MPLVCMHLRPSMQRPARLCCMRLLGLLPHCSLQHSWVLEDVLRRLV